MAKMKNMVSPQNLFLDFVESSIYFVWDIKSLNS